MGTQLNGAEAREELRSLQVSLLLVVFASFTAQVSHPRNDPTGVLATETM